MKTYKNVVLLASLVLFGVASCKKDYEKIPLEKVTIDYVFDKDDSLGTNARTYLNSIYARLLPANSNYNRVGGDLLDAASDDAISSSATNISDVQKIATGVYNPYSRITSDMFFAEYYATIRAANIFVNNIDIVPINDKRFNTPPNLHQTSILKSEARFLRAFAYFEMLKRYGGVTLMGNKVNQLEDKIELPRNSFEECVNYIVSEVDAIKDSLLSYPVSNPSAESHRVTKGAAMALKARTLLYAASPLFNGENIQPESRLTGYTDFKADRWAAASKAARDIMLLGSYQLIPNALDVFLTQNNSEIMFFRQGGNNDGVEKTNGPFGFGLQIGGSGSTSPSQGLVNAFLMNDGKTIGESSVYNASNPYANRDPRLAMTILYNGARWLNKNIETFEGGINKPGGIDQQTRTGYYMRKFMGKFESASQYSATNHDFIYFRYAEVLLNFAEAENEFNNPTDEVYEAIKSLRRRAGILPGTDSSYGLKVNMTKLEMREVIRNERRIELAFEEHRFWDIRRWKIANNVMNKPIQGMRIVKTEQALNFNIVDVFNPVFTAPKMYLYPFPYDEVLKNGNMVQNPGW